MPERVNYFITLPVPLAEWLECQVDVQGCTSVPELIRRILAETYLQHSGQSPATISSKP